MELPYGDKIVINMDRYCFAADWALTNTVERLSRDLHRILDEITDDSFYLRLSKNPFTEREHAFKISVSNHDIKKTITDFECEVGSGRRMFVTEAEYLYQAKNARDQRVRLYGSVLIELYALGVPCNNVDHYQPNGKMELLTNQAFHYYYCRESGRYYPEWLLPLPKLVQIDTYRIDHIDKI